jgi:transcriptional antiterminator RfaH
LSGAAGGCHTRDRRGKLLIRKYKGAGGLPIHRAETQCFPDDLVSRDWRPDAERRWWLLHTKARQEKSLARDLLKQSISFFAPQTEKTTLVRGRKRSAYIPIFSGYVFLYGSELDRYRSLTTKRVAQTIAVEDQAGLQRELTQIWRLIESKAPLTIEARLAPGDLVRVRSGSLAGVEGMVIERRKKCRLLIAVTLLQQGVSVEIDDFLLESI